MWTDSLPFMGPSVPAVNFLPGALIINDSGQKSLWCHSGDQSFRWEIRCWSRWTSSVQRSSRFVNIHCIRMMVKGNTENRCKENNSQLHCSFFLPFPASVQFSRSVMSDSLRPHGPRHARLPCPSPTPRVYSNSCPSSQWCHPASSSSVVPFSSCLQSCLASGSFPVSQFFATGGQSIGVSASASVFPMNIQGWFPLGWTGWISLKSKGLSRVFSNTTIQKHQFFGALLSL